VDTENKNQTTEKMMPEITDYNTINLWEAWTAKSKWCTITHAAKNQ